MSSTTEPRIDPLTKTVNAPGPGPTAGHSYGHGCGSGSSDGTGYEDEPPF